MTQHSRQLQAFTVAALILAGLIVLLLPSPSKPEGSNLFCQYRVKVLKTKQLGAKTSRQFMLTVRLLATMKLHGKKAVPACSKMLNKIFKAQLTTPQAHLFNIKPNELINLQLKLVNKPGLTGIKSYFHWKIPAP